VWYWSREDFNLYFPGQALERSLQVLDLEHFREACIDPELNGNITFCAASADTAGEPIRSVKVVHIMVIDSFSGRRTARRVTRNIHDFRFVTCTQVILASLRWATPGL
jgi:hypothetical protein